MRGTEPSCLRSLFFGCASPHRPYPALDWAHSFLFDLAIFLHQTSTWTFLETQHQSWRCPWGDRESFPRLMDVPPGLIPPRQELEAACLCPPSGCFILVLIPLYIPMLFLCIFLRVSPVAAVTVHTASNTLRCAKFGKGSTRRLVTSVPFQSVI